MQEGMYGIRFQKQHTSRLRENYRRCHLVSIPGEKFRELSAAGYLLAAKITARMYTGLTKLSSMPLNPLAAKWLRVKQRGLFRVRLSA